MYTNLLKGQNRQNILVELFALTCYYTKKKQFHKNVNFSISIINASCSPFSLSLSPPLRMSWSISNDNLGPDTAPTKGGSTNGSLPTPLVIQTMQNNGAHFIFLYLGWWWWWGIKPIKERSNMIS